MFFKSFKEVHKKSKPRISFIFRKTPKTLYKTCNELKKFMNYLKTKEDFQIRHIFELLNKFGIIIRAISKIKTKDINEEGIITFYEKK